MRVNVYAEEMTDRVEIIEKETKDGKFTGLRIYLELPVTVKEEFPKFSGLIETSQAKGPFLHREGDDDSSAITFWGKKDLLDVLYKAVDLLEKHYKTEVVLRRVKEIDTLSDMYIAAKDVISDRDVWNSDIFPREETLKIHKNKIVWESIDKLQKAVERLENVR